MGYEERMDAKSDYDAEILAEGYDVGYSDGHEDGIRHRMFYNLEAIKKPFQKICAILTGYGNFDPNIRLLRVEFFKLAVFMFNEDTKEFTRPCPCKEECMF